MILEMLMNCVKVRQPFSNVHCSLIASVGQAVGVGQLLVARLHAPDFPSVLRDGSIRAELAAAGDVVDGHLGPARLVPVHRGHHVLAADVGLHTGNGKYLLPALKIFASDC